MHQRHVISLLIHGFLSVNALLLIAFGTAFYAIIMVIASAGRNIAQKCHSQCQHHETLFATIGQHNNHYLDFRSCCVLGFVQR